VQAGSPAEKAGVQIGDRVLAVNDDEVDSWDDLYLQVATRPNRDLLLRLERNGQTTSVTVHTTAQGKYEEGSIGVLPDVAPLVAALRPGEVPGDPAIKAGIQKGDSIIAINGERVVFMAQFTDVLKRLGGREADLTIRRNGQDQHVRVTPARVGDAYMVGISIADATKTFKPTPMEAVKLSFVRNWESSGLIFRTLGGLFTGSTSVRQLQGPVGIAQLSGEAARTNFLSVLSLMAILSLNLGLINLMPVPILDGGHITIMALEGIARRDFSMQVKEKMLLAGFVVLMMLMVTVIYNDLTRISWIERLMPWRN
jgi:regulator of sigma E protease